ncbi:dipeptide ABC transporter ATP-binding protein [Natrarchaeobius chitinivorans]|uniref:Nickel import system ATP-binding protein NikD n=1 Tax=Natrarchaeobius chitinivorans TaxID=1679083 RepID=A0A3N6MMU2_NATCH|nr:ABC transporter ATP-binding protein [Natrarchaeobius chitinivorans]RQG95796.1 ABC transporter ATP-binding protein [Natrarchaeobius chitinivorans]
MVSRDTPLLSVENLETHFDTAVEPVRAVDGASFTVDPGEVVGLVGESGSGKSVTARSIVGLESPGEIVGGSIRFDGTDLTDVDDRIRRQHRGDRIGMVFQDPTATLNPVFDVGEQIAEALRIHDVDRQRLTDFMHVPFVSDRQAWRDHRERAIELMEQVDIADPGSRAGDYPHEFSGGMAQRAMLAIALAGDPDLLIADEPTTALDTTTQATILERLDSLAATGETAVLLVTHDLGIVAERCDRVVVLYGGQVMESGPTEQVLTAPEHPYTRDLLECLIDDAEPQTRLSTIEGTVPDRFDEIGCPFASRCDYATAACRTSDPPIVDPGPDHRVVCGELETVPDAHVMDGANRSTRSEPTDGHAGSDRPPGNERERRVASASRTGDGTAAILAARNLSKRFETTDSWVDRLRGNRRYLDAVEDVSVSVERGQTLGIVGESGSGKSTVVDMLVGLEAPTSGRVELDGNPVGTVADRSAEQLAKVGVVFQHTRGSINPRATVRDVIAEPLFESGWDADRRTDRVDELLELVDLSPTHADRRRHQLSGGQLQRVAIARALALEPAVVVLDEPVSALDVSNRAKILNLLLDLQEQLGLTYVVVSHDLSVVGHVADEVLVMYAGQVMERGPTETLFDRPSHPYTNALLDAIPSVSGDTPAASLPGSVPSAVDPPSGCRFHMRCPLAEPECRSETPSMEAVDDARSRCHFASEIAADSDDDSEPLEHISPDTFS